ncbi:unnamed protein product [Diamesa hyperborea]
MLLRNVFVLLMCAFVVQGTKTGSSILKQKKSIDSWNEFYVHYFGSSTVLATNWWDLWSFYFFGQFDLPMTSYEHSNSNSNLTERCDTNDVVEVNSQENIDDEICSTCADELNPQEEINANEEKCDKCEHEEKISKVDEVNFQLSSETSEDQSTFEINEENDTVIEETITKCDEPVLGNNLITNIEENDELSHTVLNNADTLEINLNDSTEPKSKSFDSSNETLLKHEDESSFLPVKLDELQVFSISNETQTIGEQQSSINYEEINTIHAAVISVSSSSVTASSDIVDIEHNESKNDLTEDVAESEIVENIIEKDAISNVESTSQESSIQKNGENVKEEELTTTVDDNFSNSSTVIKEDNIDESLISTNAELLVPTEIVGETSKTVENLDSNITTEPPLNENGTETQLEDNSAEIETDIKESSSTNENNSGDKDNSKEVNSNDNNIDTTNVQKEIFSEALNSTENTEPSLDTDVKVIQEISLMTENKDQSYEVNEETALIQESFELETTDDNNKEAEFSNIEKITTQDSDNNIDSNINSEVIIDANSDDTTGKTDILLKTSDESSIKIDTDTLPKIEQNEINIVTNSDLVSEDNIVGERTNENVSDSNINSEVIIDTNSDDTTGNNFHDLNDTKSIDNAGEQNLNHDSGNAESDSITELILTTGPNDTKLNLEDDTKNIKAEDSKETPQSNENVNGENHVEKRLDREENQLENTNPFESDLSENVNNSSTEDSKVVGGTNDIELTIEENTKKNEAEDSKETPQTYENFNGENHIEKRLGREENQLENTNPFESDLTKNVNNSSTEENTKKIEAEDSKETPQPNENFNGENHVETRLVREENSFSNGTNNNIELSGQILNPVVAPVLQNTQAPSKSGFLSHFF